MYPVETDEKRRGYWGRLKIDPQWSPPSGVQCLLIPSLWVWLASTTEVMGPGFWEFVINTMATVLPICSHSLRGKPATMSWDSLMESLHVEKPQPDKIYSSELRRDSNPSYQFDWISGGTKTRGTQLTVHGFLAQILWDNINKCCLKLLNFGENLLHSNKWMNTDTVESKETDFQFQQEISQSSVNYGLWAKSTSYPSFSKLRYYWRLFLYSPQAKNCLHTFKRLKKKKKQQQSICNRDYLDSKS